MSLVRPVQQYNDGVSPKWTMYQGGAIVKRLPMYFAMALLVFCINLSACSKDEGPKSEKGKIEKMTDHAADVVVEKIRTPIDKARSVQEMEEERMRGLDEALKEQ